MSSQVKTGVVRLSFVNVYEPKAGPGQTEEKYSLQILVDKTDTKTLEDLKSAIEFAKEAGKSKLQKNGKWKPNLKTPLRDGDEEKPDEEIYKGKMFLNCSSKDAPGTRKIVDGALSHTQKGDIYSGCYGKVTLNMFAFDSNGNAGIAAGLNNVLFVRDGDALSGRPSADADFADETGGDDAFLN